MPETQQWGRTSRKARREIARQLAKELMASKRKREWDAGWFLATFLALALLLIAPKLGRLITGVVLIVMAACLVLPIWKLKVVQTATTPARQRLLFSGGMLVSVVLITSFGLYVWPPIRRHTLSANEQAVFVNALRAAHGGDANLEVQIGCPGGDEKTCVYARQFVPLFGQAGWQIHPIVDRLTLTNASDGITAFRRAGSKEDMRKRWDSGGYVAINEAHMLAVHAAFQTLHIEIDGGANPDLAENVMTIYVGPEKDDESQPTHLTRAIQWVTGKRTGPFPTD